MSGVLKRREGNDWLPVGLPANILTEADIPVGDEDDFVFLDGSGGLKAVDLHTPLLALRPSVGPDTQALIDVLTGT